MHTVKFNKNDLKSEIIFLVISLFEIITFISYDKASEEPYTKLTHEIHVGKGIIIQNSDRQVIVKVLESIHIL